MSSLLPTPAPSIQTAHVESPNRNAGPAQTCALFFRNAPRDRCCILSPPVPSVKPGGVGNDNGLSLPYQSTRIIGSCYRNEEGGWWLGRQPASPTTNHQPPVPFLHCRVRASSGNVEVRGRCTNSEV